MSDLIPDQNTWHWCAQHAMGHSVSVLCDPCGRRQLATPTLPKATTSHRLHNIAANVAIRGAEHTWSSHNRAPRCAALCRRPWHRLACQIRSLPNPTDTAQSQSGRGSLPGGLRFPAGTARTQWIGSPYANRKCADRTAFGATEPFWLGWTPVTIVRWGRERTGNPASG